MSLTRGGMLDPYGEIIFMNKPTDAFYIGYLDKAAPSIQHVLDKVAEPIQIIGDVERHGDVRVLKADPMTYRRLH